MLEVTPVRRIGPITTEGFKPSKEDRSKATNFQLARVVMSFYGGDAIRLGKALTESTTFSIDEAEIIDDYFWTASSRIYNLPSEMTPQKFYMEQNKEAVEAIKYFGKIVPELAPAFALKDEVTRLSESPSDLFEMLCSVPVDTGAMSEDELGNVDPDGPKTIERRLLYETHRHAILHYQLGMVNARTLNGRLQTVLAYVQDLLNDKSLGIYEGPKGSGRDTIWDSFHDDETNEVVGFPVNTRPLIAHLKRITRSTRRVRDIGTVYVDDRKKDDSIALIKCWEKALMNGGAIHLDKSVQDSIGMIFVLMEDTVRPGEFADHVAEVIRNGTEKRIEAKHRKQLPRVITIEKDDHVDTDRGQASVPWNARRKIWLEDISTPIELLFSDRATYLNSQYEVGARNRETGLYMGRAHELFELRRARNAVRLVFPQDIYKKLDDHTLSNAFINASKSTAYRLRNMDRVG